jgi:hypothetical protein
MGMLDRIKKKQNEGFKEFVISMETSSGTTRGQIFTAGVLEDPVFMSYVMKNIRTFDDFMKLDSDDIDAVLSSQDQIMTLFAKVLFGSDESKIMEMESLIPRLMSKLKDEISYLKEVTVQEKDGAKFYIMKVVRKLQTEERINGFKWTLPPMDVYYPKQIKDGQIKIYFEDGTIAAEGIYLKGKRMGDWRHYYDTGKILAEGDYFDGMKSAIWKFYYSNGTLKSEGKYKADQKHGVWKEYDRNGVITEVEYNEGVKKS